MAKSRYTFQEEGIYFMTCSIVNWIALFRSPTMAQIALDSLQFLQKEQRLAVHAYVLMENHLHLIASGDELSTQIASFKSYTARQCIDYLKEQKCQSVLDDLKYHKKSWKTDRTYQFWQEGSHPQLIQGEEMMRQKIEYIHLNPVRRGYVDEPVHWRYSSARNYENGGGLIDIVVDWM